jgi:urea transport system permease protein
VYGSLLVNYGKTYFSESFPELWLYLMGGLFIAVVMYFPDGLAGVWETHGRARLNKLLGKPTPVITAPTKAKVIEAPIATPVAESLETQP